MTKYYALRHFLENREFPEISMSFSEIESVIQGELPQSARKHRAWWSNNPSNSVITKEWLEAGFKTEQVDMANERLVFRRVRPKSPGSKTPPATPSAPFDPQASGPYKVHPAYGALKGLIQIAPGVDLTEPADPDWGKVYD